MKRHSMTLNLGVLGEVECLVTYTYYAGEKECRDNPGCPEEFEIDTISADGVSINHLVQDWDAMHKLVQADVQAG